MNDAYGWISAGLLAAKERTYRTFAVWQDRAESGLAGFRLAPQKSGHSLFDPKQTLASFEYTSVSGLGLTELCSQPLL